MLDGEPDPDIDVQKETTAEKSELQKTLDKMSAASKTRTANSPGKRKRSAQ